jgi:molybdopterin-guanine dinucleotide biosynthesis protein A
LATVGFDAVVLAGGAGRRLGGADKAEVEVAGARLLDRVLDAVAEASLVVVVGPRRRTTRSVTWTRESPPGAGPVAALAAGVARMSAPIVVVLAVDLPLIDAAVVGDLVAAVEGDGAILIDASGRDQTLAGAYRRDALRRRLEGLGETVDAPVRAVVEGMSLVHVPARGAALDCDTWDDVAEARRALAPPRSLD